MREHALGTLNKLAAHKIELMEAGVTAKLYESIISSLKTEIEYHKMLGNEPTIKFLEGAIIEKPVNKKMLEKK